MSIKPLKQIKQVNIKLPGRELEILKAFAAKTGRRKGEVVREFIKLLKDQLRSDLKAAKIVLQSVSLNLSRVVEGQ